MTRVNDEQILGALLAGGSVRRAAKIANISESTVRARLTDQDFRSRYESEKNALLGEVCDSLVVKLTAAVDALSSVLDDEKNPATVRINAADSLLRHGLRYVETANILRRLDALEEQAGGRG